ncbi:MAG: HAMP domain-containing histidine kinase [Magnetococcales bacterium]|nr:HAMP domain-containing histidine kinase [Magnetococcales bacterium]
MMMATEPETGLTGLLKDIDSDQWSTVREAVDQAGGLLRQGGLDPTAHSLVGQRLAKLSTHPKWEVRKALAHACLHLRHDTFDRIMAALDMDDNDLVRNAAKRTLSRRSELSRTDMLKDQHGDLMLRWLEELEAKHGPRARNAARRVAEKLHGQFVKELNHEMVKVISPLDASLENIEVEISKTRSNPDDLHRHTRRARERVRFLISILESLRALTQEVEPDFQTESLRSMVEEAIHLVRDRKKENRAMEADIRIDPAITVEANRHLLLQALTNIIQNSVDAYAGARCLPVIAITAHEHNGSRVQVTIVDQGCGMSEEAVKDAFQLFATSKPHGTGFGLTIAKKIIESDHNGMVYLGSVKGKGTTVTIMLPKEQEGREW